MVFIDVRRKIGAGEIGSANLALSAAENEKIGSFSLAKATGTLVNASIGSLNLMYGSSGTLAGPLLRGGRVQARKTAAIGTGLGQSRNTLVVFGGPGTTPLVSSRPDGTTRTHYAAAVGTTFVVRHRYNQGTWQINTRAGTQASFSGAGGSFPTVRGPYVGASGSFLGTIYARVGSFGRTIAVGTLRVRSFGSVQGTLTAHAIAARGIGSFQGTVYAHRIQAGNIGSFTGTVYAHYGTFGTVAGAVSRFRQVNVNKISGQAANSIASMNSGSFINMRIGTLRVRNVGSISGTLTAHRAFITSLPGTTTVRTAGTTHGWFAAPANARYITVSVQTAPSVTNPSGIILRQQTMGTIGQASSASSATVAPAETMNVSGWVLPGHGSYMVGTLAGPIPVIKFWREYDP